MRYHHALIGYFLHFKLLCTFFWPRIDLQPQLENKTVQCLYEVGKMKEVGVVNVFILVAIHIVNNNVLYKFRTTTLRGEGIKVDSVSKTLSHTHLTPATKIILV